MLRNYNDAHNLDIYIFKYHTRVLFIDKNTERITTCQSILGQFVIYHFHKKKLQLNLTSQYDNQ